MSDQINQLWQELDIKLKNKSTRKQLQIAANYIFKICKIFTYESLNILEDILNIEHVITDEELNKYINQYTTIDLNEYVEEYKTIVRKDYEYNYSQVNIVENNYIEEKEIEEELIFNIEEINIENYSKCISDIKLYLNENNSVLFSKLNVDLNYEKTELLISLLVGSFNLNNIIDDFYADDFLISL